ncbi:MAG: penicillin-binding protein activator [Pseudomonadota bacterium]
MKVLRILALAPSLALISLIVAGCASAPARPPAPISTGDPRVDPQPQLPGSETADKDKDGKTKEELDKERELAEGGLTPPHMLGRDITRAAVLLPFSHPNARVREEAQGMLAGAELALFDRADGEFLLIPKDTAGTTSGATAAYSDAIEDGADVILGPLFAENVRTLAGEAREAELPMIAFSNDPTAAGNGAYLASFTVEEEVARVVAFALQNGIDTFAFLGPRSAYGQRVERALRFEATRGGAFVIASAAYDPSNDAPVDEAEMLANSIAGFVEEQPGRLGVIVPETGDKLRSVAPLLAYYGVDFRGLTMLGTSQWNDPGIWREPTLNRALFPVPPADAAGRFNANYTRLYGRAPTNLAGLGYDAATVAIELTGDDQLDTSGLIRGEGFDGVTGLFRFRPDGTPERGLAVMQIKTGEGAVEVSPAPQSFFPSVG